MELLKCQSTIYLDMEEILILVDHLVKMNVMYRNIDYFKSLGFENIKCRQNIFVLVSELPKNSHKKVIIKCDYCSKSFCRIYRDQLIFMEKSKIKKDACKNCRATKTKESNMITYGVKSIAHLDSTQKKREKTNIEKYGHKNIFEVPEYKEKISNAIKEKYGVDNVFQNEDVKKKIKKTNLERYGYEYASQNPDIKDKSVRKYVQTMYINNTANASSQQKFIHKLVGGIINYPVDRSMLDIGFPEKKTYLEYQGSGHDLDVKLGNMTKEKFFNREKNRYYYLKNKGWKMIEIVSKTQYDYLPNESKIKEMVDYALKYFENNNKRSFISFDIDESIVRTSKFKNHYDFGKLMKTNKGKLLDKIK